MTTRVLLGISIRTDHQSFADDPNKVVAQALRDIATQVDAMPDEDINMNSPIGKDEFNVVGHFSYQTLRIEEDDDDEEVDDLAAKIEAAEQDIHAAEGSR